MKVSKEGSEELLAVTGKVDGLCGKQYLRGYVLKGVCFTASHTYGIALYLVPHTCLVNSLHSNDLRIDEFTQIYKQHVIFDVI